VVTLDVSIFLPLTVVITLTSASILMFLWFLNLRNAKAGTLASLLKKKFRSILLTLTFTVLIWLLFVEGVLYPSFVAKSVLVGLGCLVILLLVLFLWVRAVNLVSLLEGKIEYFFIVTMFGSIITFFLLADITIVFNLAVMIAVVSLSLLILLLILRLKGIRTKTLISLVDTGFRLRFFAVMFGSIISFFIFSGILKIVAIKDISFVINGLKDSDRLRIWNSVSTNEGTIRQEVIITEREIKQKLSDLLSSVDYKLHYSPGFPATIDALTIWTYNDGKEIGNFSFLSGKLKIKFFSFVYLPSNKKLVTYFRETIGGDDGG